MDVDNSIKNELINDNYEMKVNNERIFKFYESHPEYDFEEVCLMTIDLIENWKLKSTKNDVKEIIKESATEQTRDLQHNIEMAMRNNTNTITERVGSELMREIEKLENMRGRNEGNIMNMLNNMEEKQKEVQEFLNNYKNSSIKGGLGENFLEGVLNEMYPSGEVTNTSKISQSCDFKLDRGNGYDIILIETKEYGRNVDLREVEKFKRDVDVQNQHAIFLSQKSGISTKNNYQFEFKGTNVLVYVHNVNYNSDLIRIAVNIIDSIAPKLREIDKNIVENSISDELMNDLNIEMKNFIENKLNIIKNTKDFSKKMIEDIENISMPSLSKLLFNKYGASTKEEGKGRYLCDICNVFRANNKRIMQTHKNQCKILK